MSLPGDQRIDTDPQDEPARINVLQNNLNYLRTEVSVLRQAHTVLADDSASSEARELALRVMDQFCNGVPHLIDNTNEMAVRMQEEIDTLSEMHAC